MFGYKNRFKVLKDSLEYALSFMYIYRQLNGKFNNNVFLHAIYLFSYIFTCFVVRSRAFLFSLLEILSILCLFITSLFCSILLLFLSKTYYKYSKNINKNTFIYFLITASCLPWVPEQGTVGASGDLAPLSHLALGLMGEGHMWSPQTGWGEAKYVLESHNLTPIHLGAKEGLALINGTQLITSIGAEAVERAGIIAKQADVVASLTLEVLKGTSRAFDSGIV